MCRDLPRCAAAGHGERPTGAAMMAAGGRPAQPHAEGRSRSVPHAREAWTTATQGSNAARVAGRSRSNEVPTRHIPSTTGRTSGRTSVPSRRMAPERYADVRTAADSGGPKETVELVTVAPPAQRAEPVEPPATPAYPSRPDPNDAAAEVWALVERAQPGDGEAFGLHLRPVPRHRLPVHLLPGRQPTARRGPDRRHLPASAQAHRQLHLAGPRPRRLAGDDRPQPRRRPLQVGPLPARGNHR